jgi:predicted transcriptional regulator
MIENEGKGKLEEKRVTDLIRERGERFHRRGRKPKSPESQRLSKNALRLLRHILKVTSKEDPIWSESVEEVAKVLGIDPSTVKRLRRRFCEVGVLVPQERKGGRGKPAQYQVDLEKAETLVREGVWGAAKKGGEKEAQKPGQEPKPAQEIPAPKPPSPPVVAAPEPPKLPTPVVVAQPYPATLLPEESIDRLLKWGLFLGGCALGILGTYWTYKKHGLPAAIVVGTGGAISLYYLYKAWIAPQPAPKPQLPPPPALPPATPPQPSHWGERIRVI